MNGNSLRAILFPTQLKRLLFFYLADTVLIAGALYFSFLIHLDFNVNVDYFVLVLEVLPFFLAVKLVALSLSRVYRLTWRYVGIVEMVNIAVALIIAELILVVWSLTPSLSFQLPIYNMPRRIFLVDGIISLCLLGGLRISKRLYLEVIRGRGHLKRGKRSIIVGAGNTGYMILKDMTQQEHSGFHPVAFLDDNPAKVGTYLGGVKVAGTTATLKEAIERTGAEAVLIAIPSLNHKKLRTLYDTAKGMCVGTIKVLPRIYDFDKPNINLKTLEDISIEDLIGRQSVDVDVKGIEGFIRNRSVLVTGAGGSIGSEIARQVSAFDPARLILFDVDETELHNLGLKLQRYFPGLFTQDGDTTDKGSDFLQSAFRLGRVIFITGDIRDRRRVEEVFCAYGPEIVFHAAAYKHVPMMEFNPKEAVKVNIFGTRELAKASIEWGVEKFIMISTDKAVRPTSIMGATKRIAEYICRAYNEEGRGTRFISVRFGNVLGSRGSVLPLFLDQLQYGGPLTVTHREMQRYFMTIPEAVSLVLQASTMGLGGEVFVLDMGEPVKVVELAEELIRIHGMEPYRDVDIEFTGLRPGEKLFEEILTAEEGTVASKHEKVFVARDNVRYTVTEMKAVLERFEELLVTVSLDDTERVQDLLRQYVPYYDVTTAERAGGGDR